MKALLKADSWEVRVSNFFNKLAKCFFSDNLTPILFTWKLPNKSSVATIRKIISDSRNWQIASWWWKVGDIPEMMDFSEVEISGTTWQPFHIDAPIPASLYGCNFNIYIQEKDWPVLKPVPFLSEFSDQIPSDDRTCDDLSEYQEKKSIKRKEIEDSELSETSPSNSDSSISPVKFIKKKKKIIRKK